MRNVFRMGTVLGLALLMAFPALAQPLKRQGPRPGGGNPLSLLFNPAVREELKISEEQMKQMPEAMMKALEGVLDEKQLTRLKQIQLQQRGAAVLLEEKMQSKLKLSADQKESLALIAKDAGREMKELFESAKNSKDFKTRFEVMKKVGATRKERDERMMSVLNADQKEIWQNMVGEEFEVPRQGFGGFRFPGKGGKKGGPRFQKQTP